MNQIPNHWHSERLSITNATDDELPDLQNIYQACAYIGEWCGPDIEITGKEMGAELRHENLPPDGKAEFHRVQTIREKENEAIIGYLLLYHGFPDEQTFWIATLAVHPDYQGQKYGQEIIEQLCEEVLALDGYTAIGGSVGILNWPALRFWIQAGFDRIVKFEGDKEFANGAFADLWLKKEL